MVAIDGVEPTDKISFVYNCIQTRLRGQYKPRLRVKIAGNCDNSHSSPSLAR